MSAKRKRVVVTIEQKLEAVRRVENGEILRKVAADLGVGISSVSVWVKNKSTMEEYCSKMPNRKSMKPSEYNELNEALHLWFTQAREKGTPISGPILMEKAKMLSEMMGESYKDFSASSGWLDRWKTRYGVRKLNLCGEKMSADEDAVNVFKTEFEDLIKNKGYNKDQIFNADETGLNFKMLPRKSLASKSEASAPGHKLSKERITVLACSNASGSFRLPLLCIGKSMRPRALKNINPSALPVEYKSQKNAWMSSPLFTDWFHNSFVPKVKSFLKSKNLPEKAILLIDNSTTHPNKMKNGEIEVTFLPPNVTSLLQPMDQGVLECFKRHYRKRLLRSILFQCDENESVKGSLKKINMKHVLYWCAESWNDVKPSTLEKSWNKIFDALVLEEASDLEDESLTEMLKNIPGCEDINVIEADEWVNSDERQELTDEDIVQVAMGIEENEDGDTSDDDAVSAQSTSCVTAEEGFNALEVRLTCNKSLLVH